MVIGDIISNKYILIKKIGTGHFSEVWLCIEIPTKKYHAIKIFDKHLDVAKNELKILAKIKALNNPNCLTYTDKYEYDDKIYIIQPLMAGSIYDIMSSQYPSGFPFECVKKIIRDILQALNHLHTKLKLIHADIKPENILLVGRTLEMEKIISKIDNCLKNIKITKSKKTKLNYRDIAKCIKNAMFQPNLIPEQSLGGMQSTDMDIDSDDTSSNDSSECSISTVSDIHSSHSSHVDRMVICSDTGDDLDDITTSNMRDVEIIIDVKYILSPTVVLADFGNSIDIPDDTERYGDIQTRHYTCARN